MASGGLTPRGVRCNLIDDALALQFGDGMSTVISMDTVERSKTLHASVTETSVENGWVLDAPGRYVRNWLECLSFLGILPTNHSTLETIQSRKIYNFLEVRYLQLSLAKFEEMPREASRSNWCPRHRDMIVMAISIHVDS
jgi:hypothetical protein